MPQTFLPQSSLNSAHGKNVRFFSITPPGTSTPLLYTTMSAQNTAGQQSNEVALVLVVPAGARVRITNSTPITDDSHMDEGHYMDHDLRYDLMLYCHDFMDHPGKIATAHHVKSLAWFPGVLEHVRRWVDDCTDCSTRHKTATHIGCGIIAEQRFEVVQIDHKILDAVIVAATGCPALGPSRMSQWILFSTSARRFLRRSCGLSPL